MTESPDQWRMYGLVAYNLSPIQQGIQFGHAVQEYNNKSVDGGITICDRTAFNHWRLFDKTFIILNGGTTNTSTEKPGSLNLHLDEISKLVSTAAFYEPDLGDQLTSFVFLVNEKVYNKKTWPDYDIYLHSSISESEYYKNLLGEDWSNIVLLRQYLSKLKLA